MGSGTWFSLPDKYRPLPDRTCVVVSRRELNITGAVVISTVEEAMTAFPCPAYVIGGGRIYNYCLQNALVDHIIASEVDDDSPGDVYFPQLNWTWQEVSREPRDGFSVVSYQRDPSLEVEPLPPWKITRRSR